MPQLDVSTWPSQLFWLAISFFALYFVVSRLIIPRTGGVIELRKTTVETDLAAAVKHKTESEAALKDYEALLANVRGKANQTSVEAREALNIEMQAAASKLDGELKVKAAAGEKAISAAKDKALAGISGIAAELSAAIVTQLTGAKVTAADAASAVSKAGEQGAA